jgi:hypothetical protein
LALEDNEDWFAGVSLLIVWCGWLGKFVGEVFGIVLSADFWGFGWLRGRLGWLGFVMIGLLLIRLGHG